MYGCESWTVKTVEHWRTDAFELWCWRRLLRVPCFARRSNQSILKEISPEYSLEGLMLKLKLQYFGYLMWRTNSLEKTLMLGRLKAGGEGDNRAWDGWMSSPTQWTWVWVGSRSWWWIGRPGLLQSTTERLNGTEQADEASWPPIRQSSPHTFPEFPMQLSGLCLLSQVGYLVGRRHSILIHLTDRYV